MKINNVNKKMILHNNNKILINNQILKILEKV